MTVQPDSLSHFAPAVVTALDWDTRHFGISAARLDGRVVDDAALGRLLSEARVGGCDVVYWFAEQGRSLPADLLNEFGGSVVCRRVTYVRDLEAAPFGSTVIAHQSAERPLAVAAYPRQPADRRLLQLGVDAGAHSRFSVDRRFVPGKVRELYEVWMSRSTLGEIADEVFVAAAPGGDVAGVITVAVGPASAEIGLLAVGAEYRGQGLGTTLLRAVDEWSTHRELPKISVVTQLENEAACRLYERAGFRVDAIEQVCHFWPQHDANSGKKARR